MCASVGSIMKLPVSKCVHAQLHPGHPSCIQVNLNQYRESGDKASGCALLIHVVCACVCVGTSCPNNNHSLHPSYCPHNLVTNETGLRLTARDCHPLTHTYKLINTHRYSLDPTRGLLSTFIPCIQSWLYVPHPLYHEMIGLTMALIGHKGEIPMLWPHLSTRGCLRDTDCAFQDKG